MLHNEYDVLSFVDGTNVRLFLKNVINSLLHVHQVRSSFFCPNVSYGFVIDGYMITISKYASHMCNIFIYYHVYLYHGSQNHTIALTIK